MEQRNRWKHIKKKKKKKKKNQVIIILGKLNYGTEELVETIKKIMEDEEKIIEVKHIQHNMHINTFSIKNRLIRGIIVLPKFISWDHMSKSMVLIDFPEFSVDFYKKKCAEMRIPLFMASRNNHELQNWVREIVDK